MLMDHWIKKILNIQKHPILFRLAFKQFLFKKKKSHQNFLILLFNSQKMKSLPFTYMDKHDKLDKLPLERECDGVYGHVSVLVGN